MSAKCCVLANPVAITAFESRNSSPRYSILRGEDKLRRQFLWHLLRSLLAAFSLLRRSFSSVRSNFASFYESPEMPTFLLFDFKEAFLRRMLK